MTTDEPVRQPLTPLAEGAYYAVIFTSLRTEEDHGYAAMAQEMDDLAIQQPGYLGHESARTEGGVGITISYWRDEQSILAWKANAKHLVGQKLGKSRWYSDYTVRIARVERAYRGS
ncbi:MAG: antibiotic biosynthesis monooxygenase [Pseudomonadota bacterium]